VLALTALNWRGVQRSVAVTRIIVAVVLAVLVATVIVAAAAPSASVGGALADGRFSAPDVLRSAGLIFFAFAGYARIATLGEEVRDPARTIPRAIPLALLVTCVVYAAVAVAALAVLGPDRLAGASAPLAELVAVAGADWMVPVVRVGAATAALGSLLALILGVSRTAFAMARDRNLPAVLDAVHPRFRVPHRAELAVGLVVAGLAATVDLRAAIGFSSLGVLLYYAIANAAAFRLGRQARVVAVAGLVGCLVLAAALPVGSVIVGGAVVGFGAAGYAVRGRLRRPPAGPSR
jgi:APA family basic amino acid/polyamine antiporter